MLTLVTISGILYNVEMIVGPYLKAAGAQCLSRTLHKGGRILFRHAVTGGGLSDCHFSRAGHALREALLCAPFCK